MDIENLIADLQEISQKNSISHYKRGRCAAAATAISTLQAENEKLRAEADGMRSNWYKAVEEIKKLRAELERVKAALRREQDGNNK